MSSTIKRKNKTKQCKFCKNQSTCNLYYFNYGLLHMKLYVQFKRGINNQSSKPNMKKIDAKDIILLKSRSITNDRKIEPKHSCSQSKAFVKAGRGRVVKSKRSMYNIFESASGLYSHVFYLQMNYPSSSSYITD